MNVTRLLESLFGCHHSSLSRVFTIGRRTYRVCCECGAEFDYSLEKMAVQREQRRPPARYLLWRA
jgi:hypothetical protein